MEPSGVYLAAVQQKGFIGMRNLLSFAHVKAIDGVDGGLAGTNAQQVGGYMADIDKLYQSDPYSDPTSTVASST